MEKSNLKEDEAVLCPLSARMQDERVFAALASALVASASVHDLHSDVEGLGAQMDAPHSSRKAWTPR